MATEYYVHVTDTQVTIHKGDHYNAAGRHGPFGSKREAVTEARILAARDVENCDVCGGAGKVLHRLDRCHCATCLG